MLIDGSQSDGAVATRTGENDPNCLVAVGLRKRLKKRIGGRAGKMNPRALIEPNPSRSHQHVMVRRRDVDVAGLNESAISTMSGGEHTDGVQNRRKVAPVLADVDHHKK